MSANPREVERKPPAQPKAPGNGTIPPEVKIEIENLRRLVQTVHERLHALTRKSG